jgi:hypothetical protein
MKIVPVTIVMVGLMVIPPLPRWAAVAGITDRTERKWTRKPTGPLSKAFRKPRPIRSMGKDALIEASASAL